MFTCMFCKTNFTAPRLYIKINTRLIYCECHHCNKVLYQKKLTKAELEFYLKVHDTHKGFIVGDLSSLSSPQGGQLMLRNEDVLVYDEELKQWQVLTSQDGFEEPKEMQSERSRRLLS